MAREVREFQDLAPQDFCYFPYGRGVLWTVLSVWVGPTGVSVYADSGIIKQSFKRPIEWPMTCVV